MDGSSPTHTADPRSRRIARWLGETVLFTALGLAWAALGFWLQVYDAYFAWLAIGACVYGLLRPVGATLGRAVVLASCGTLVGLYYEAGWSQVDWERRFTWLTPTEFATWFWRGNSGWLGEGPSGAQWTDAAFAILVLLGPIALGLLFGRLVGRRGWRRRRAAAADPAAAD